MDRVKKCLIALFSAFLVFIFAAVPARSPLRADIPLPPAQSGGAAAERGTAAERVLAGGIDLNTADAEALMRLPGIGEVLAGRIIAWRERNGPFRSAEELLLVDGIGDKTLENILIYSEDH